MQVLHSVAVNRATYASGDYGRYSRHCAVQVSKLRAQTDLQRKSGRKPKAYAAKPVSVDSSYDDRHMLLVLYDAERAWARAQTIKGQAASGTKSSKRHLMLKRLKKAIAHAELLVQLLVKKSAPSMIQAEATAYANFLKASYLFEKADPASTQAALEPLQTARALLILISQKTPQMTVQAFAYELLEDVEQMTRVALHRTGQTTPSVPIAQNAQALQAELDGIESTSAKIQTEFRWKDQTITVQRPALAKALVQGQATQKDKTVGALEKKLTILGQGEDMARRLAEENQVSLPDLKHQAKANARDRPHWNAPALPASKKPQPRFKRRTTSSSSACTSSASAATSS
jgi:hypothetical protein